MNGLFGSRFGHFEQLRILNTNFEQIGRITRIKTDQTILSLLVGSMERAEAFSGDGVRPVHLPPGKEEEGTALPPDEPNRPFPVGSGA